LKRGTEKKKINKEQREEKGVSAVGGKGPHFSRAERFARGGEENPVQRPKGKYKRKVASMICIEGGKNPKKKNTGPGLKQEKELADVNLKQRKKKGTSQKKSWGTYGEATVFFFYKMKERRSRRESHFRLKRKRGGPAEPKENGDIGSERPCVTWGGGKRGSRTHFRGGGGYQGRPGGGLRELQMGSGRGTAERKNGWGG